MKVVKNKSSGRFLIVLEDTGDTRFLLCTPEGKIKRLERRLFGRETTTNHQDYRWNGNLTNVQMDAYVNTMTMRIEQNMDLRTFSSTPAHVNLSHYRRRDLASTVAPGAALSVDDRLEVIWQ